MLLISFHFYDLLEKTVEKVYYYFHLLGNHSSEKSETGWKLLHQESQQENLLLLHCSNYIFRNNTQKVNRGEIRCKLIPVISQILLFQDFLIHECLQWLAARCYLCWMIPGHGFFSPRYSKGKYLTSAPE